jgi:diketogulonate reductase-like aldo/keto reductase
VELHLYCQQKLLREICKEKDITVCAYAPLGTPKWKPFLESMGVWVEQFSASSSSAFFIIVCDFVVRRNRAEHPSLLEDTLVIELSRKYGRSPAQILLRFLIQEGISVIPKSTSIVRLQENIQVR